MYSIARAKNINLNEQPFTLDDVLTGLHGKSLNIDFWSKLVQKPYMNGYTSDLFRFCRSFYLVHNRFWVATSLPDNDERHDGNDK